MKADYDIVYKNVLRRYETNSMDLYCFFDAVEILANKAYKNSFSENL
jgi:hypothetical protein